MTGPVDWTRSLDDLLRLDGLWAGRRAAGWDLPGGPERVTRTVGLSLPRGTSRFLHEGRLTLMRWQIPASRRRGAREAPAEVRAMFPLYRDRRAPGGLVLCTWRLTAHLPVTDAAEALPLLARLGLRPLRRCPWSPRAWSVAVPEGETDPVAWCMRFAAGNPRGLLAIGPELVWPTAPALRVNCVEAQWQWHGRVADRPPCWSGNRPTTPAHAHVDEAMATSRKPTGAGIRIAILDAAFQWDHPGLGTAAVLPGSGGFVTSAAGIPAFSRGTQYLAPDGVPRYHGTNCAGMAAARASSLCGGHGAAPGAGLMLAALGSGVSLETLADAVTWAADPSRYDPLADPTEGAGVISCSLKVPRWTGVVFSGTPVVLVHPVLGALRLAARRGRQCLGCAIFWAVSGVSTADIADDKVCSSPYVMAVGTSDCKGKSHNARGSRLAFVAPGTGVHTITTDGCQDASGTSLATPCAAGVAALVLEIRPSLTAAGVRGILEATCDPVEGVTFDAEGFNVAYGHGRINALRAVQAAAIPVPTAPFA